MKKLILLSLLLIGLCSCNKNIEDLSDKDNIPIWVQDKAKDTTLHADSYMLSDEYKTYIIKDNKVIKTITNERADEAIIFILAMTTIIFFLGMIIKD